MAYLVCAAARRARVDLLWFLGGARRGGAAAGDPRRDRADRRSSCSAGSRRPSSRSRSTARATCRSTSFRRRPRWRSPRGRRAWPRCARSRHVALAGDGAAARRRPLAGRRRVVAAGRPRLGGLPQLAANLAFDLQLPDAAGSTRVDFLARSRASRSTMRSRSTRWPAAYGPRRTAGRSDSRVRILAGVYVEQRPRRARRGSSGAGRSSSSLPPASAGYGSAGLLAGSDSASAGVVALQKKDWGGRTSRTRRSSSWHPALRAWLEAGYALERTRRSSRSGGGEPDVTRRRSSLLLVDHRCRRRPRCARLWLRARSADVRVGRHRLARRGRVGAQRAQPRALGRVADRQLESRVHRAGVHGARVRRVRAFGVGTWQARTVPVASGLARARCV